MIIPLLILMLKNEDKFDNNQKNSNASQISTVFCIETKKRTQLPLHPSSRHWYAYNQRHKKARPFLDAALLPVLGCLKITSFRRRTQQ